MPQLNLNFGGKCPCCNNPWNLQASGDDDEQHYALLCDPCIEAAGVKEAPGINRKDFDDSVDPGEDFYSYAIGGWKKANPIPPEYPSWDIFTSLHDTNQKRLKDLVDDLSAGKTPSAGVSAATCKKVADFFNSAMDEETINKKGWRSCLSPIFELVDGITGDTDLLTIFGQLARDYDVFVPIKFSNSPDKSDSNWTIGNLSQGGLGLPDRDYYIDEDKEEKRKFYKEHVANILKLIELDAEVEKNGVADVDGLMKSLGLTAGIPEGGIKTVSDVVFALESKIATEHMSKTDQRDPHKTYNKMEIAEFQAKCTDSNLNWSNYIFSLGFDGSKKKLGPLNIRTVDALIAITKLFNDLLSSSDGVAALKIYLKWHVAHNFAAFDLPKEFNEEHFDFYSVKMQGQKEMKPRWKRSLAAVESQLGEALGEMYVGQYFPQSAKAKALEYVEMVRFALEGRLKEVEWMTAQATRDHALEKMKGFKVKIGYPDEWLDYSKMKIKAGDHFGNVISANRFHFNRMIEKTNAETDRKEWLMTPQTINAYYHPSLNEIVFPAAILQPPFFDPEADLAVNFGAMGAVIGHEMTHGFDDQGRKYDASGNLRDWWTESDGVEYEKRAQVMIDQAESFEVHGQHVKGKLTCGENIADLGGLKLAMRALEEHLSKTSSTKLEPGKSILDSLDKAELVNGFTHRQRLFFSWARVWAQNSSKERELMLLTVDPHGPNKMRVNGTVSNIPEFVNAFGIPEGKKMAIPKEKCVDIW